jgi:5-methylcytosine-specific restriction endonuclease McrA
MPTLSGFPADSNPAPLKTCSKCSRELPITDYYVKIKATGRLHARCKTCFIAITTKHINENRDQYNEYARKYRAADPEKYNDRSSAWKKANRHKTRETARKYRAAHPDKIREKRKRYKAKHPDVLKASRGRYYAKHRLEIYERLERCRKAKPELYRIIQKRAAHKRRAIIANAGTYTLAELEAIKAAQDYRCLLCGLYEPFIKLTVDHVVPLSKGGSNTAKNLQMLCHSCNSHKRTREWDFRDRIRPRKRPTPIRRPSRRATL